MKVEELRMLLIIALCCYNTIFFQVQNGNGPDIEDDSDEEVDEVLNENMF